LEAWQVYSEVVKERGAVRSKIDTIDAAVAYATYKTMPEAVMDDLYSI
jgi:hypothetical protein